MKCADCGQDILQAHPELCPYCKSKNLVSEEGASIEIKKAEKLADLGRYEEAALIYEKLDKWDSAKVCRRMAQKNRAPSLKMEIAKVGTVMVICPHCHAPKEVKADSAVETCSRCGTKYKIPNKVRELLSFEQKV